MVQAIDACDEGNPQKRHSSDTPATLMKSVHGEKPLSVVITPPPGPPKMKSKTEDPSGGSSPGHG